MIVPMLMLLKKAKKKLVFKKQDLILNFDRIFQDATNFIRGNPFLAAGVGLGAPVALVGIATVGRRVLRKRKSKVARKKRKVKKVVRRKKRKVARKRKITHASPRHKGHKVVSFTTADGKKVRFKVKRKKHRH